MREIEPSLLQGDRFFSDTNIKVFFVKNLILMTGHFRHLPLLVFNNIFRKIGEL